MVVREEIMQNRHPGYVMKPWPRILAACLAALVVSAVLARPASAFFEFTVRDEIELGKKFDTMVRQRLPIVEDPEILGYCQYLVRRIVDGMPPQPFPIKVTVIRNPAMNAFAVPGGYVYIFTGLLTQLDHESQLAAVISHELAHVSQRHVADRMERMKYATIASTLGTLAGVFLGMAGGNVAPNLGPALMLGSQAGAQTAFLVYTQDNEREADHVGMNYLLEAGYRPSAMPETFELMQRERWNYGSSTIPSYLSTHPGLADRVGYLNERVSRLPPNLVARMDDDTVFQRVRAIVRARYADPAVSLGWYERNEGSMSCLDVLGYGITLARVKKTSKAEEYFHKALDCGRSDPVVLRETGRYFFENGEYAEAEKYLKQAVAANPEDSFALFFLARVQGENKEYSKALDNLIRVAKKHPDDSEVQYFLGRMYGQSGDHFNGYLHLAYSAVYRGKPEKAEGFVKRIEGMARTQEQKDALAELKKQIKEKEDKKF